MQGLINIVDNMTGLVRFVIGAMVLSGFALGLFMTAGISYVAPKVADEYGERAERLGEQAIKAAQEEARARELAQDGWGYSPPSASSSFDESEEQSGGWGAD